MITCDCKQILGRLINEFAWLWLLQSSCNLDILVEVDPHPAIQMVIMMMTVAN